LERAILVRHGESVFSVRAIMNGDVSVRGGLTAEGSEQARALGEALRGEQLDLCVTSELERAIETANEAVAARDLPRLVVPELNDPRYGPFEGKTLDEYRAWAGSAHSSAQPGEGGESRREIIARYAAGYRTVLERPEPAILVVCHSLPVSYALLGRDGSEPSMRVPLVPYATPYPFTAAELRDVVGVLERWLAEPSW
jgi:broad specificity phosphatase PhoE